ncbi:MAG: AAA family ATPase, partial [Desulfamplus sp.]|nr:AAA family ATPase [Desulfamplus sp.]
MKLQLPYGTSDFHKIITKYYFYCDRTDRIPLLEQNDFQLFLRPRRFGKTLLLSMLENYYDVAKKDQFKTLFSKLKIGKNPTPLHNSFYILKWDFSCINASGSTTDIQQSLYNHINDCIKEFILYYRDYNIPKITINPTDALSSIKSLTSSMRMMDLPVY